VRGSKPRGLEFLEHFVLQKLQFFSFSPPFRKGLGVGKNIFRIGSKWHGLVIFKKITLITPHKPIRLNITQECFLWKLD
jgi:hypothetical protein